MFSVAICNVGQAPGAACTQKIITHRALQGICVDAALAAGDQDEFDAGPETDLILRGLAILNLMQQAQEAIINKKTLEGQY